jgi:O-antigen/teichoic acid export membrane protein
VSLRRQILEGGAYLAAREAAGIVVRLAGVLALTRILGPERFGLYAGPAATVTFLGFVSQWGTEVFLIRREEEPARGLYDEVFTFLLASATSVGALALGLSFAFEAVAGPSPFFPPFRALLVALPLNILWAPAQARLERAFRFRSMAVLELGGDVVLYGSGVGLALAGAGVWAPVTGYVAWQGFLLLASFRLAAFLPRLRLTRATARELWQFGLTFSSATWFERGRELVNPLVVGSFLGPAAVGYVALALRIGDTLAFVSRATWRVSVAALGRIQSDVPRVRRAVEEGILLQVLASGAVLATFAVVAEQAIPLLFGDRWQAALDVFPFVAASYLLAAAFSLHSSLLYVMKRNARVAKINAARLAALSVLALGLVPLLGVSGFGIALLGSQAGLLLLDREVRRVFDYRFRPALAWLVALGPPLFLPVVGWPLGILLLLPILLVSLAPLPRAQLAHYAGTLRSAVLRV